jgi:2-methylisocitrate lyase-like PEP mutase family enzyme
MPEPASAKLQELIHRRDKVLAVLHPPTAAHARIMERAGCEALFVGTGGVVGAYTGMADVGTATLGECVEIAGWIADSVKIPVIMDGDTGHGGIMAVRRMVRDCIRRGIAGVRIDDQPIEGKRKTQSAGVEVVPLELAIARYRAAVDMKNELAPNFVVMAQCYARDAANGGLDDALTRLKAYREEAKVDWVQLESPHSTDEIRLARAAVEGPFSFMKGKLGRYLGLDEHLALGVTIAWYPGFTHHVTWAALWDSWKAFASAASLLGTILSPVGRTGLIRFRKCPMTAKARPSSARWRNAIYRPRRWRNTGGHDGARRLSDFRFRHPCRPRRGHSGALSEHAGEGPVGRLGELPLDRALWPCHLHQGPAHLSPPARRRRARPGAGGLYGRVYRCGA